MVGGLVGGLVGWLVEQLEFLGVRPRFFERQGQGMPAQGFAQLYQRWDQVGLRQDAAWIAQQRRLAVAGQVQDAVGVLRHALQPVLRKDDGQSQVVIQPQQRIEHLFGGLRVELRGRLVEHQHLGL